MNGKQRIELIVIDLVERIKLPQDIRIKRKGKTLYTGSVIRTPKELLNEIILNLYSTDFPSYIVIEIE